MAMSEIKALEKLRDYQLYDKTEEYTAFVQLGSVLADEIQAEVDERFMELPLDADGVPIRLEDELEYVGRVFAIGPKVVFAKRGFADGHYEVEAYSSDVCRHVKPRTMFDVLAEVENGELSIDKAEAEIRELLGVDA